MYIPGSSRFLTLLNYLVEVTSFNFDTRKALDTLNKRLENPERIYLHLNSHPGGYTREIYKRRISIAEAYIIIAHELESDRYEERLRSLKTLAQLSLHAKNISLPLNTARVQISLMKEAIKKKGDYRRQLELITDFTIASFGQWPVIKKLLNERNMIQVPELGKSLKDLNLGWDSHVHDSMSEGRKTPSQVLLDAFVKGLSSIRLMYYDINDAQIIREAFGAGRILGIDVQMAIEFSVGKSKIRRHYAYIPGNFHTADQFMDFFKKNEAKLSNFLQGLHKNSENRRLTIESMIKNFNETHLIRLNSGYKKDDLLFLPPLAIEDLKKVVMSGQYSRIHLGELLFSRLFEVTHKRVLHLRTQYQVAMTKKAMGFISQWELDQITNQYETVRKYYEEMSPERLREKFLEDKAIIDYDSAFLDESEIFQPLVECGGDIKFIHPLEVGLKNAAITIIKNYKFISRAETFNNTDAAKRNPNDLILFNRFIEILNNKPLPELKKFLSEWDILDLEDKLVEAAHAHYHSKPLIPECGSDAIGRDPKIPGMGFIKSSSVPAPIRKWYLNKHSMLPSPISSLIMGQGRPVAESEWKTLAEDEKHIVLMGKSGSRAKNLVGDETGFEFIGLGRYFKYLNPNIKNVFRIIFGFIPAFLTFAMLYGNETGAPKYIQQTFMTFGIFYASLWFFITFFRNVLVDLVSAHGFDIRDWGWHDVNFDNAFQSLFWTGFSVPVLNAVKNWFEISWPAVGILSPTIKEVVKFFFLCAANGVFIVTHNRIRNFDEKVIKANFFRSIFAWPFATLFSPLGNILDIPSIVQTKFWSDMVASVVEGTGKFTQRIVIRKRDLNEIIPQLSSPDKNIKMAAALDILYIWARQQRGNTCLEQILLNKTAFYRSIMAKASSSTDEKKAKAKRMLDDLCDFFTEEGSSIALNYFVLENYSGYDSVVLTNIIGNHFEQFKEWLYSLRERTKKEEEKTQHSK